MDTIRYGHGDTEKSKKVGHKNSETRWQKYAYIYASDIFNAYQNS